jgi:CPW-WPC domain-containing protein
VHKACPDCNGKDYSDLCPLGWDELNDGRCKAPLGYEGPCANIQTFVGSSVVSKMETEIRCEICWPCTNGGEDSATCERDWAKPCPNGYAPQDAESLEPGGVTCLADMLYEGKCEQQVSFNDLQEKHDFAERCQTSWPCRHG